MRFVHRGITKLTMLAARRQPLKAQTPLSVDHTNVRCGMRRALTDSQDQVNVGEISPCVEVAAVLSVARTTRDMAAA